MNRIRLWWRLRTARGRTMWHIKWFRLDAHRLEWLAFMGREYGEQFEHTNGPGVGLKVAPQ